MIGKIILKLTAASSKKIKIKILQEISCKTNINPAQGNLSSKN